MLRLSPNILITKGEGKGEGEREEKALGVGCERLRKAAIYKTKPMK